MSSRRTRAQQNEANRAAVMAAAGKVFRARGYHAATLEDIAERAGFSRGVVYSRFDTKADLFLALLEERIESRLRENADAAEDLKGHEAIRHLIDSFADRDRRDQEWGLLLIEFRVHAARDRRLNNRYAALHERTLTGLTALLEDIYTGTRDQPPLSAGRMAEMMLALSAGLLLEESARPEDIKGEELAGELGDLFTGGRRPAARRAA
jgi:AcrR family transcriptional regulator